MIRNFVALPTVCGVNAPGSNEPELQTNANR